MTGDPHAPKLSPDDPSLRLARPGARTLRTGPVVLVIAGLSAAAVVAVVLALETPASKSKATTDPSGAPAPPTVPESIRNGREPREAPRVAQEAPRQGAMARAAAQEPPERSLERETLDKARGASILFESALPDRAPEPGLAEPSSALPATMLAAAPTSSSDPNLQDHKNAFLAGQGAGKSTYLEAVVQHPRSPFEIQAGSIVPAVLLTAINSDLPGPVVAQVREHVYDSVTGDHLLVPQGSRLLAQYDSMVAWGQERVLVCWNRLLLPNGDSVDLKCMPAADLSGAAGLSDEVDEHWWRILKGATVATLLSAGTAFAAGDTVSYNPTVAQLMARSAAGEMGSVGQQLTRNNLSIQPTLTVRPGFSVNVIVTKDIVLSPYPEAPAALGLAR